jgi:hypothetical protein
VSSSGQWCCLHNVHQDSPSHGDLVDCELHLRDATPAEELARRAEAEGTTMLCLTAGHRWGDWTRMPSVSGEPGAFRSCLHERCTAMDFAVPNDVRVFPLVRRDPLEVIAEVWPQLLLELDGNPTVPWPLVMTISSNIDALIRRAQA